MSTMRCFLVMLEGASPLQLDGLMMSPMARKVGVGVGEREGQSSNRRQGGKLMFYER